MRTFVCMLLAFCGSAFVSEVSAQVYRWTDELGAVHYSDALPSPGTFRDLEVYEGGDALSPHERRTLEIVAQEARAGGSAAESPQSIELEPAVPGAWGEPTLLERIARVQHSAASENVRDPCLLSWDPQCYEKNAQDYDPRFGYAPSILRNGDASALATLR